MKHIITLSISLMVICNSQTSGQRISKPLTKQIRGIGETGSAGKQKAESNSELHATSNSARIRDGMHFTPNQGQIVDMEGKLRPDILYNGSGDGADIYLRKTGVSYVYSNMGEVMYRLDEELEEAERSGRMAEKGEQQLKEELMRDEKIKVHRVDMNFAGCRDNVSTFNEDETAGISNYYYAHCPNGILNVKQYSKVVCKNIYENIDVIYYASALSAVSEAEGLSTSGEKEKGLKYDIVVNPYADPYRVKLSWSGAEGIYVNSEGDLVIKTSVNEFFESIPKVYQLINGRVIDVKARYILNGTTVSFELGIWNPEYALIIDPATWITYYGGSSTEYGAAVCVDKQSNVLFTGSTGSLNFPISTGAFQSTWKNSLDAFVVKVDPVTGFPIWSTYFGGSGTEYSNSVTTDGNNNVLIAGYVQSIVASANDLPIATPVGSFYQGFTVGGSSVGFVAKFDPAGALIWSTHFGGNFLTELYDICSDASNNFFIVGRTGSSSGLPLLTAYQPVFKGGFTDCCVVKFNNAQALQWSTYYGGTAEDRGWSISCDIAGNVFITGSTKSSDFPILGACKPVFQGGTDSFLAKMNPATGVPLWSTYYGGALVEYGFGVANDNLGNVIITGSTTSTSGIATPGAFQMAFAGGAVSGDTYIAKYDNGGNCLWSTYLGGSVGPPGGNTGSEEGYGIAVDNKNNIIVAGDTYSTDFPVTSCAYQTTFKGTEDQYITTFDPSGKLICSGYLGLGNASSPHNEGGFSMVAVYGCYVYLVGSSTCNYPVTTGAFQTNCGGGNDAVFSKLYTSTCGGITSSLDFNAASATICSGQSVNYTSSYASCDLTGITYLWTFPGGTPSGSTSVNPTGITYNTAGIYPVKLLIQLPCGNDSLVKTAFVTVNSCGCQLRGQITKGSANCTSCGCKEWIMVTATGGTSPYSYTWPDGFVNRYKNQLCPGVYSINIKDKNGCSVNVSLTTP